jgi:hypothetical protein
MGSLNVRADRLVRSVEMALGGRALPVRSRPGHDRASGVGCTAWFGGFLGFVSSFMSLIVKDLLAPNAFHGLDYSGILAADRRL